MQSMREYYHNMILMVLEAILTRSGRSESCGFINTKLSLFTGNDFANDGPIKGPSTIFSWIQGRGLEALAVHYKWLHRDDSIPAETRDILNQSCLKQLAITLNSMEKLRQMNSGRLLFMHNAGSSMPLKIDNNGNEMYDMWEFTHENPDPYYNADGQLLSDPGHATEFTGLAGKLLLIAVQKGLSNHIDRLAEYKTLLPAILQKNFKTVFQQAVSEYAKPLI